MRTVNGHRRCRNCGSLGPTPPNRINPKLRQVSIITCPIRPHSVGTDLHRSDNQLSSPNHQTNRHGRTVWRAVSPVRQVSCSANVPIRMSKYLIKVQAKCWTRQVALRVLAAASVWNSKRLGCTICQIRRVLRNVQNCLKLFANSPSKCFRELKELNSMAICLRFTSAHTQIKFAKFN